MSVGIALRFSPTPKIAVALGYCDGKYLWVKATQSTRNKRAVGIGFKAYTHGFLTFTYGFLASLNVKFVVVKIYNIVLENKNTRTQFHTIYIFKISYILKH